MLKKKNPRSVYKDKKKRNVKVLFYYSFITFVWNDELGQINCFVL